MGLAPWVQLPMPPHRANHYCGCSFCILTLLQNVTLSFAGLFRYIKIYVHVNHCKPMSQHSTTFRHIWKDLDPQILYVPPNKDTGTTE
jgi:hypothetical protein